jgi:UDP-hydrolysing UDP-N-acetyl-D-glucosamine 2-epimerase
VLHEINKSKSLDLRLIVTGTHTQKKYGRTADLIKKDGFVASETVPVPEDATMLEALSKEIAGIEAYCTRARPDIMLVWGDRDESFAGAIVAGHLRIPLAHVGGGDTSGYVVDEAIRHSISKFANVHFPISQQSAHRIARLGEEKKRIHMTGTTALDEIKKTALKGRAALAEELGLDATKPWILFVQHPTPLDVVSISGQITPSLEALKQLEGEKIIIYPNSDTGADTFIKAITRYAREKDFHVYQSLSRETYLAVLKHCAAVLGNSSSGIVEAGFFKTPAVDIGNRQKGREHGKNVIHAGYEKGEIAAALRRALSAPFKRSLATMKNPYGSGSSAKKIVRVLEQLRIDESLMYKQISLR